MKRFLVLSTLVTALAFQGQANADLLQFPLPSIPVSVNLIAVTVSHDSVGGNDGCNLREAITVANGGVANDCPPSDSSAALTKIVFDPSVAATPITLNSSLPMITDAVIIEGAGITVQGNDTFQLLNINAPSKSVTIKGLTMTGGMSPGNGGALELSAGTLALDNVNLHNNTASVLGGAVANVGGTLIMGNSVVGPGNQAAAGGGVASSGSGNVLTISNSAIYQNTAVGSFLGVGGGVFVQQTTGSSISNSTLAQNSANADGGGVYNGSSSTLTLNNVTLAYNSADADADAFGSGGGIDNAGGTLLTVTNSLLVQNNNATAAQNCVGVITSGGHNLESGTDCGFTSGNNGDLSGVTDPKLDTTLKNVLRSDGSVTTVLELLASSPAIDAADTTVCSTNDQRGNTRNGPCDIGATEFLGSCGDGLIQTTSGEVCDDGNPDDGDGCSSVCAEEDGFTCADDGTGKSVCTSDNPPPPAGNGDGGGCSLSYSGVAVGQWPLMAIAMASLGSAMIFRRRAK